MPQVQRAARRLQRILESLGRLALDEEQAARVRAEPILDRGPHKAFACLSSRNLGCEEEEQGACAFVQRDRRR